MRQNIHSPSFVHSIEVVPFRCIMWSEPMLECYVAVWKFERLRLSMDATGGPVRRFNDQSSQIFILSLGLQHPKPGV